MLLFLIAASSSALAAASATLVPLGNWTTYTFYDVVPEECRFSVTDNNLANVFGDLYFSLKDKYLPVACAGCDAHPQLCQLSPARFDCNNPESVGDLVVRVVEVEVRMLGTYAYCDVWPGHAACSYACFRGAPGSSAPHRRGVGVERVCTQESPVPPLPGVECGMAPSPLPLLGREWDYWNYNLAARLGEAGGGLWYSLSREDEGLHWRSARVTNVVPQRCHTRALDAAVASAGAECFAGCAQPTNASSACHIKCYFEAVLGPDADRTRKPLGRQEGAMALGALADAWLAGLVRCPPCPPQGPCPDVSATRRPDSTGSEGDAMPAPPQPQRVRRHSLYGHGGVAAGPESIE